MNGNARRTGTTRLSTFTALLLSLCAVSSAWSQQNQVFGAFYRKEFTQLGDFVFTNTPYQTVLWEAWVRGFPKGELSEVRITTPAGKVESFDIDADGPFETALSSEFPPGAYSFTFEREDNSTFEVNLTQPAATFPAIPSFQNLFGIEIKPGNDLRLPVRPGADARTDDVLLLNVIAFNTKTFESWLFSTPWPGETGALPGTTSTVTVPGFLLKPNDSLQVRLISYRAGFQQPTANGLAIAGSAIGVFTTLTVADAPQDNDVANYRLLGGRRFLQEENLPPIPLEHKGFAFEATAWERSEGRLSNVTVAASSGVSIVLEQDEESLLWETNLVFDREDQIPAGVLTWTFDGIAKGRQTVASTAAGGAWPDRLSVLNWAALQTNSFTNNVTLQWSRPAEASAFDQIEFIVESPGGAPVFRAPDYSEGDPPISGTATELRIRAGTLADGEDYVGRLRSIRIVSQDTASLSGATGTVARCSETRFPIGSRTARPLMIVSEAVAPGTVAESYSAQLQAAGGRRPWTWSLVQGNLPSGVSLSGSGAIRGIPWENGMFDVAVQVADSLGSRATRVLALEVNGVLQRLSIVTTNLPRVVDGYFYYYFFESEGGAPPYEWSIRSGQLPPGLRLHPRTGMVNGQAEEAGVYPFEVELMDGAGQIQRQNFVLDVPSATNNPPLRVSGFASASSSLAGMHAASSGGQFFKLRVNAQPDELITLDSSRDLNTWQPVLTTNLGAKALLEWAFPNASYQFYRVRRGEPEPEYNPVTIHVTLNTNNSGAGILTSGGLSLGLTNSAGVTWRLDIPPNAVLAPVAVSMTLVESANGFPFEIGFLGGVSFAPEGLTLLTAATLTGTFPISLPADTSGFGFDGSGADFHLKPAHVATNVISFPITHFSGAMGGRAGSGDKQKMVDQHTACSSQTSHEAQLAHLIDLGASKESLWAYLQNWFYSSVNPKLKAAAGDDQSLWSATSEALAWLNLAEKYAPGLSHQLSHDCWKALARAFASAVDRSAARCLEQKRPFQAIRMMKIAQAARGLGLESGLSAPYDETYFSEEKMLERYKKLFRFELEIESSHLNIRPKKGGSFVANVHSEKCPIEAKEYDYGDEDNLQKLNVSFSKRLTSEVWDLFDPDNRVSGVVSEGNLISVRLYIWPKYPKDGVAGRCPKGLTWDDPTDPGIELVFDATDPVKQMRVETFYGPQYVPISPKAGSMNWWGIFRMFHALQLVDDHDASGQAHLLVPKIGGQDSDDWDYLASDPFAIAEFHGPPEYADQYAGEAQEDTVLKLHHAPKSF